MYEKFSLLHDLKSNLIHKLFIICWALEQCQVLDTVILPWWQKQEQDIFLKCNDFLKGNVWYMSNWQADSEYIF